MRVLEFRAGAKDASKGKKKKIDQSWDYYQGYKVQKAHDRRQSH